jgi:hypothetical protein
MEEAGLDVGVELLLNDSGGNLDAFLQIRINLSLPHRFALRIPNRTWLCEGACLDLGEPLVRKGWMIAFSKHCGVMKALQNLSTVSNYVEPYPYGFGMLANELPLCRFIAWAAQGESLLLLSLCVAVSRRFILS